MNENIPSPIEMPEEGSQKRAFTPWEVALAWISWLCGYIFCRANGPLAAMLFLGVLYLSATVILKKKGAKFTFSALAVALSGFLIGLSLFFTCSGFIQLFSYGYSILAWLCYVHVLLGNALKDGFTDYVALDFFKAAIAPFFSIAGIFRALFYGRGQKSGKLILKIIIGLCIAFIPTVVVLALLSYDSAFNSLLNNIFSLGEGRIFNMILAAALGLPVAMYIFGAYISAEDRKTANVITVASCEEAAKTVRVAPAVTVLAATAPILFIYIVFFISQWSYYISGFTGVLPEGFSYADYAREGFFQLCIVSVINLAIVAMAGVFMNRGKAAAKWALKAISIIYAICTLVLIATALAKLFMYIEYYGLTPKRVYAAWFMAVLAIVFILVIIKQFVSRMQLIAASLSVLVIMFALLSFSGSERLIARYNVDRYLEGSLATVDVSAMEPLRFASVPEMVRLKTELEERGETGGLYGETLRYLNIMKIYEIDYNDELGHMNLPWILARKALGSVYLPDLGEMEMYY
ncbi:MAG: DUF4173 domain-containing protein [Oscillospiraceae bacterium]|nr:DUF4173 domain-containing protein [Oscillospiraceae bacterium]